MFLGKRTLFKNYSQKSVWNSLPLLRPGFDFSLPVQAGWPGTLSMTQ